MTGRCAGVHSSIVGVSGEIRPAAGDGDEPAEHEAGAGDRLGVGPGDDAVPEFELAQLVAARTRAAGRRARLRP